MLLLWIRCTGALLFFLSSFVSGFSYFLACNLRLQSTSGRPSQNICISISSSTAGSSKVPWETGPECHRTGTEWFLWWNLPNRRRAMINLSPPLKEVWLHTALSSCLCKIWERASLCSSMCLFCHGVSAVWTFVSCPCLVLASLYCVIVFILNCRADVK